MFLTRVELNAYRRTTVELLASPQKIHAAVMASFNSFEDSLDGRILWRIDRLGPATYLLIQSPTRPDVHHIVDQYGRPDTGQKGETKEYGNFLDNLKEGQQYRFRLVANPVHSVMEEGCKRGKVYAHVTMEQQLNWLIDRCDKCGFSLKDRDGVTAHVTSRGTVKFKRKEKSVTITYATFEGILTVLNPDILKKTMINGIGRAKSYGCGMMTIIPI